jgi:hypothetical protein
MTDYSELKRLAEHHINLHGDTWHAEESKALESLPTFSSEWFVAAASPKAVLTLIEDCRSAKNRLHEVAVGCATAEQERDHLKAEVESLRKDSERNQRMLLASCLDLGTIGEALGADMNSDGGELLGIVIDLKAQNSRLLGFLSDISKTSGDKGAVMGARELLKEAGQ